MALRLNVIHDGSSSGYCGNTGGDPTPSVIEDRFSSGVYKRNRGGCQGKTNEKQAGRQEPTQVGLALQSFSIQAISALSPQAKGRVERLFATLQDPLGAELRLKGIVTLEGANRFLQSIFIRGFNRRFAVKPKASQKAWRKLPKVLAGFFEKIKRSRGPAPLFRFEDIRNRRIR